MTTNKNRFRLWDSSSKNMINMNQILKDDLYDLIIIPPDNIIVMQYTGLDDVDGNEIYEDDIVYFKTEWDEHYGVVKFMDTRFQICQELKGDLGVNWGDALYDTSDSFKVIGNIHETPDYLNRKDIYEMER